MIVIQTSILSLAFYGKPLLFDIPAILSRAPPAHFKGIIGGTRITVVSGGFITRRIDGFPGSVGEEDASKGIAERAERGVLVYLTHPDGTMLFPGCGCAC